MVQQKPLGRWDGKREGQQRTSGVSRNRRIPKREIYTHHLPNTTTTPNTTITTSTLGHTLFPRTSTGGFRLVGKYPRRPYHGLGRLFMDQTAKITHGNRLRSTTSTSVQCCCPPPDLHLQVRIPENPSSTTSHVSDGEAPSLMPCLSARAPLCVGVRGVSC